MFPYWLMPFGLKNAGATFQWDMTFCFYDLIHIILVYFDDLTAHSRKCSQHIDDLRQVFLQCRKYNVPLNPLNYVFCVLDGCLLGFIVSHKGIMVNPLKQAILNIPSPCTLRQLQSLQGKANFLHCFIPDYATKVLGFLRLLCFNIPFVWDKHP